MGEITAAAVKELRDRTGAGMMDCKRALGEADGDQERAIDLLRQRGAAKAATRAQRETSEGTIQIAAGNGATAMVEVLSETDFVSRSDDFIEFAMQVANRVQELELPAGEVVTGDQLLDVSGAEDLGAALDELRVKVGENVHVSRAVRLPGDAGNALASYVHFGNRIGVLIEMEGGEDSGAATETARSIAMHIAATDPAGIAPDDIPSDVVERERGVLIEQAKDEGKPAEIAEKIVEGRMRKFFEQNALLWQPYVRDPDLKISDVLAEAGEGAGVRRFVRFEVGA